MSLTNIRQPFALPANLPAGSFVAATAMNLSGSRWRPRRPCWWQPGAAEQWQTQRPLNVCWTALANPSMRGVCTACSVRKVFDRDRGLIFCGLWSSTPKAISMLCSPSHAPWALQNHVAPYFRICQHSSRPGRPCLHQAGFCCGSGQSGLCYCTG